MSMHMHPLFFSLFLYSIEPWVLEVTGGLGEWGGGARWVWWLGGRVGGG